MSLASSPVSWRQRRNREGFTWGVRHLLQGQSVLEIDRKERHRHTPLKHPSSFTGREDQLHCQRLPEFAGPLRRGAESLKCCVSG